MNCIFPFIAIGVLTLTTLAMAEDASAKSKNLTERVAHEIVAFDYSDIPPEVIEKAEQLIRDSLACAVNAQHDGLESVTEACGR